MPRGGLEPYIEVLTAAATVLGPVLTVVTIAWVLVTKKNSTSAVAWCLVVFFLPLFGPLFFWLFGYQHVSVPLSRKRQHRKRFRRQHPPERAELPTGPADRGGWPEVKSVAQAGREGTWPETRQLESVASQSGPRQAISRLAHKFGAYSVTTGNRITFFDEGRPAFEAMLEAIAAARHHVHLETFIFQPDATGQLFLETLARKARQGVAVRLLYDAMGSHRLHRWRLQPLREAGGKYSVFLPLNPLRRRIQVNMRNHRKICVVDGRIGFTGGLNIGDEYLGKNRRFGFWRDTHLRVEGPAVSGLQRVFIEDWDFAAGEDLQRPDYFPPPSQDGPYPVQVIESGPDREQKGIREIYFAAMLQARQRLWIASPYFVPDAGLLDALCLAGYMGIDVRLLIQRHPDKWIPYFAGRYYLSDVLDAGVKVYQYTRGMMHSKVVLVDGEWASVGTANLDNRSMHLNFEVNCLVYSPAAVAQLEGMYRHDLTTAIRLDRQVFARRPFAGRLLDNGCRLLSPVL
jgi:cardiolipin synthase A/B